MSNETKTSKLFSKQFCRASIFLRAAFFVALFFAAGVQGFAKSLQEYKKNVAAAKKSVVELIYPNEEDLANKNYPAFERQTLNQIRARVPATEKIEWQGADIETDNQWLVERLDELERTPANAPRRWEILIEIGERLEALEQKLNALEKSSVEERTKDETKRKLAEILRREEYAKPQIEEESFFERTYRKFMRWLREKFPRADLPDGASDGLQSLSFVLQMLLYALVLGVIAFLLKRFAPFLLRRFGNENREKKQERVILGERIADDESARDLFDDAEKLAREGNLRAAIRKGYIAVLCELADRKIIGLSRHKTNRDYLRDVRKKRELFENMNNLTLNFERHWYGFDEAEAKDWEDFKVAYLKTVETTENR